MSQEAEQKAQQQPSAGKKVIIPHPDAPSPEVAILKAIITESEGHLRHLRGDAQIETTEMLLKADEIDYDDDTKIATARGRVYLRHYFGGEEIWADRAEYNMEEQTAKYYAIHGISPAKLDARPGVLTSPNPFAFQGKWAERIKDRYILHDGFVTVCKVDDPAWKLTSPRFDIIPGDRALIYRAIFRLKGIPIFYAPLFRKSLERMPRQSGFLTPNIGNSSRLGKMIGVGYYWAINRSYDATYLAQYFTVRGLAHHLDFRGKPTAKSDFNLILYGVQDRGEPQPDGTRIKQGGLQMTVDGKVDLGHGWFAKGEYNYLSSLTFRQAFTQSFYEAIFSELHSTGFVGKEWSTFSFYGVAQQIENFQSTAPNDRIVIRKLPSIEFNSRDREIKDLPFWVSFDSSMALLRRDQPLFQTRQFLERFDFAPRIMTRMEWHDFQLVPSFTVRETHWGESVDGHITGQDINRNSREVGLDLSLPALARIYRSPKWLGADKVKHVIEPRVSYRFVDGVADFNKIIRFDETELLTNTNEVEFSLTNRLYSKQKDGQVSEIVSWQLWQKYYFDPSFGGAVVPGQLNMIQSVADFTGYTFLDRPRRWSPVVSSLRVSPGRFGVEWRADYDPLRHKLVNSTLDASTRVAKYSTTLGYSRVACVTLTGPETAATCADNNVAKLLPIANQVRWSGVWGNESHRGWAAGFSMVYDVRLSQLQYTTTQVTYNNDCCGLSVQFRRFSFGTRNENQFRVAFAIANIGSFGTLKKQEKLF